MTISQQRINEIRLRHWRRQGEASEMNKSHITDEQVDAFRLAISKTNNWLPSINDVHAALEAAFPEQQPAAFGKLVVTDEMARQYNDRYLTMGSTTKNVLQSFVDRHSLKPIAFADRVPEKGETVYIYSLNYKCWFQTERWVTSANSPRTTDETHWLPASALPIPEPVVDPMEAAWNLYRVSNEVPNGATLAKQDFIAGYEAGQAGGSK
jgi:hypothetical protein